MDSATIVKRIRAANGLTRSSLARLAGVSPSTVTRIENGDLDPTWSTLQKMLSSTGMCINRNTVVSAGDPSAISSARAALEGRPATASPWAEIWKRSGWLKPAMSPRDVLSLSVVAGNAGKFARRATPPLYAELPGQKQWQDLARALSRAGVEYAVSGLVATSRDRVTDSAAAPIVYVRDPQETFDTLGLTSTQPLRGTMILAPTSDEMDGTEDEGGIRFVSRAQAMLDTFASGGRQPEKAESVALSWKGTP